MTTKPTQAQIEAADIIKRLKESITTFNRNATHTLPAMDGFIRRHLQELDKAIAALTAAAEVGQMASLADEKLVNSPNARTAAAEVGEKPFGAGYTKGYNEGIRYATKETIERCAQWLEDNYPTARTIAFEMRHTLKETKE